MMGDEQRSILHSSGYIQALFIDRVVLATAATGGAGFDTFGNNRQFDRSMRFW
jgi:hypothetical protein